jgi:hypothetical protein
LCHIGGRWRSSKKGLAKNDGAKYKLHGPTTELWHALWGGAFGHAEDEVEVD